ncbi:DUF3052 family protein [Aurantiacibacter gangjinensis]|uniref:Uncharacterized protein n=1 Tax=Aurantiacibacter gangjinensis TaxID=502682 RepID=A0A0G9MQ01_9SPHN|nr:DUF3052 family protein [Aurantiacibacter gangjinensis]APE28635.1 hypothetical protein BMF35_a1806 [Aurantiacibacter gangjinensis]KLE32812.1 hypothetical protein AAW01_01925 [Aurantiacibacter gangjinensis]
MTEGYSGTPLAQKLTLKDGMRVWFDGMPPTVLAEIEDSNVELCHQDSPDQPFDAAHIFVSCSASLTSKLADLTACMQRDGQIWISWPKKSSGVETQVGEHDVREAGLDAGLVDTKKCAVDETWSGLKFVIRKDER